MDSLFQLISFDFIFEFLNRKHPKRKEKNASRKKRLGWVGFHGRTGRYGNWACLCERDHSKHAEKKCKIRFVFFISFDFIFEFETKKGCPIKDVHNERKQKWKKSATTTTGRHTRRSRSWKS